MGRILDEFPRDEVEVVVVQPGLEYHVGLDGLSPEVAAHTAAAEVRELLDAEQVDEAHCQCCNQPVKHCAKCGKLFGATLRRTDAIYCSRSCARAAAQRAYRRRTG